MPYANIGQLPDPVRNTLPKQAQEIFVEAFNSAYEKLSPGQDEIPCFKIGWAAVKRNYEKKDGKWRKKAS